jgi:SAM-dependent methyltransferase
MPQNDQPNREQAARWNVSGSAWVELQPMLDRIMTPIGALVIDAGYPGDGGSVLDIGCGAGATTLAMAHRVGARGRCVGVDISHGLVELARSRARDEGLPNASFVEGDAQTHAFDAESFDAVISRFGVMFFDNPIAAFVNIRTAARPGGKLAFVAWRGPAENGFMTAAARAAAPFLPPSPPQDPEAPGQFAFADGARVKRILEASGWTSVQAEPADIACEVPEGELMTFATRLGPIGGALREVDQATAAKVIAAIPPAFAPFVRDGTARFIAACWLVTARA